MTDIRFTFEVDLARDLHGCCRERQPGLAIAPRTRAMHLSSEFPGGVSIFVGARLL
jgi:hypothetical protein